MLNYILNILSHLLEIKLYISLEALVNILTENMNSIMEGIRVSQEVN